MKTLVFQQGLDWLKDLNLSEEISGHKCHVRIFHVHGGLSNGMPILEVSNGPWIIRLLPSKGMSIWNADWKGTFLGWKSPVRGPVHPALVENERRGGLGWLDGFDEWFCRCGLSFNGPPGVASDGARITLHGRIANLPAHKIEVQFPDSEAGEIVVKATVEESSLFSPLLELQSIYRLPVGKDHFFIEDTVTNKGTSKAFFELLYHCNVGVPLLGKNSFWKASSSEVSPQTLEAAKGIEAFQEYGSSQPGYKEQVFLCKPACDSQGTALSFIANPETEKAFSISYKPTQLPCFTVWKNLGGVEEGYVTGLEPAINYPNFIDFEKAQGRGKYLEPGQIWNGDLKLEMKEGKKAIKDLENKVAEIETGTCVVHKKPVGLYSPNA